MTYSHEVETMCPVKQGVAHGAAPIPEEAKWVKAKEISDIKGCADWRADIVNEIYLPGGGGSVVVTDSTSSKQLQVFTNLEMLHPAVSTRAVDNQWEANDMIGISSTGMINNMKFTRNGSTNQFVSTSKVFFTDTDTHTFNAYYPYMANPTNDIIEFQVPEAAVQSEQKVNDFLFASGTASYASPSLT